MPVDMFGFYTLLEPYIGAYYELEATKKARELFLKVSNKYQESLSYYSGLSQENQSKYIQTIYSDIERYRSLVDVTTFYESEDFIKTEMGLFYDLFFSKKLFFICTKLFQYNQFLVRQS